MEKKTHVYIVEKSVVGRLKQDLEDQGFEITPADYAHFKAAKRGVSLTMYTSGKCVVQGKESKEFIEFYLEPQILQTAQLGYEHLSLDLTPRIGIDESGKGDFFGPLCVAGVYAEGEQIKKLLELGVCDSKKVSDVTALKLASKIQDLCVSHVVRINPLKYNEIYPQFGNLNKMLAWGHATTIEQLMAKTSCSKVIIDQFADERVVLTALRRKRLEPDLTQRHRAEEDIVVAAASILARAAFLSGLKVLETKWKQVLPKGASAATKSAAKKFAESHGKELLREVAKLHFKTYDVI